MLQLTRSVLDALDTIHLVLILNGKVLQRVYKYGGQPFVRDWLATNHGDNFDRIFGKGNGKAMMSAFSGRYIQFPHQILRSIKCSHH